MIAAQKRGVKVRVMLNPARRNGEDGKREVAEEPERRRNGGD